MGAGATASAIRIRRLSARNSALDAAAAETAAAASACTILAAIQAILLLLLVLLVIYVHGHVHCVLAAATTAFATSRAVCNVRHIPDCCADIPRADNG